MAKLKIGNIEGESEEVVNLLVRNNINLSDFLEIKPQKKIGLWWLAGAVICFFVVTTLIFVKMFPGRPTDVLEILNFFIFCLALVLIHLRCENGIVTTICGLFGVLLLLVCFGVLTPKQAAQELRKDLPGANKPKKDS